MTDYRASHVGRGWDYHRTFVDDPRMAMLWRREKDILRRIASDVPQVNSYLDFACGTGRVAGFVAGLTSATTIGIDVSESMLAVARQQVPSATFILGDLTTDPALLAGRRFDLITAFQFFPNAQPELRAMAMSALVSVLEPGGLLVFNNHQNDTAIRYRLARMRGRRSTHATSDTPLQQLVSECGLREVSLHCAGVVPQGGELLRPSAFWEAVDAVASRSSGATKWATNLIHVAVRV